MKILKTNQTLLNLKGEELKDGEEIAKVGDIIANILCGVGIQNPSRAFVLAKKLSTQEEVELKAEDIVYLKTQIETASKYMSALVVGQIIEILEN